MVTEPPQAWRAYGRVPVGALFLCKKTGSLNRIEEGRLQQLVFDGVLFLFCLFLMCGDWMGGFLFCFEDQKQLLLRVSLSVVDVCGGLRVVSCLQTEWLCHEQNTKRPFPSSSHCTSSFRHQ